MDRKVDSGKILRGLRGNRSKARMARVGVCPGSRREKQLEITEEVLVRLAEEVIEGGRAKLSQFSHKVLSPEGVEIVRSMIEETKRDYADYQEILVSAITAKRVGAAHVARICQQVRAMQEDLERLIEENRVH